MTMLKSLYDFSLMDLLPESLTRDPQIKACIEGLDEELRKLSSDIRETLLISRIDELSEDILDLLAWQFHLDFYQPTELNIETKRQLIRESIADHRIRGTPAAVEKLLTTVFKNAQVKEWWEFDGEPFQFRIEQLGRSLATEQDYADFEKALDVAKNVRSHLESFTVRFIRILESFIGFVNFCLKVKSKRHEIDLKQQKFTNFIGFMNSEVISKMSTLRNGIYTPAMTSYVGFINDQFKSRFTIARSIDFPKHDLRSTSILDLLVLNLGILREEDYKSRDIWEFRNFNGIPNYLAFVNARNIDRRPSNKIRQSSTQNSFLGFINERFNQKLNLISLKFTQKIELSWYIFAARQIIRHIKSQYELESDAMIKHSSNLNIFAGLSSISLKHRDFKLHSDFTSNISNFIGFILAKSIWKKFITKDVPVIEPITFNRKSELRLYTGFARNSIQSRTARLHFDPHMNLNLVQSFKIEKYLRDLKFNRMDLSYAKSATYVGFLRFINVYRYSKIQEYQGTLMDKCILKFYIGFTNLKYIRRKSTRKSIINLQHSIFYGFINSRSKFHSIKLAESGFNGGAIDLKYDLKNYIGFSRLSVKTRASKKIFDYSSQISISNAFLNFKTIVKWNQSRDVPNIPSESINKFNTLKIYNGIFNFKFIGKFNSIKKLEIPKIYFNLIFARNSIVQKMNYIPIKFKSMINSTIGILSRRSIIRKFFSDFKLDSIPLQSMKLQNYQGFPRISSINLRKSIILHFKSQQSSYIGFKRQTLIVSRRKIA